MSEQKLMERSSRVQARRIKVDYEVAIRPPDAVEPVRVWQLYNMSMTGMFICADSLLSPGTLFSFEIRPSNDARPIEGKAQVVWVRQATDGPNHQAGMGAHFHSLDEENQSLLRQLIEAKQNENLARLSPADQLRRVVEDALTDNPANAAAKAAQPPPSQRPAERTPVARPARTLYGTSVAKSARERRFGVWPLLILLLLAVGAGSLWFVGRGGEQGAAATRDGELVAAAPVEPAATPLEPAVEDQPTSAAQPAEPVAAPSSVAAETDGPATELTAGDVSDFTADATGRAAPAAEPAADLQDTAVASAEPVPPAVDEPAELAPAVPPIESARQAVESWASAWSDQRVDDYLMSYASGFVPPRRMSRSQWERNRRERLTAPSFISVRLSQLEIMRQSDDRARAVFLQNYRSNTIADMVEKTLELVWEDGAWRILSETSKPVS